MLSGPIWRWHEVSLWSLFLSRDRMVLGFDLVGSRARGVLQAYKTVLGETLLLGRRQYNHDGKLNEAGGSHCLPSWSHTLDLAKNVTRMWKVKFHTFTSSSFVCLSFPLDFLINLVLFLTLSLTADYKAFQEASERFQPYIKFFATFDKSVSNNAPNKICFWNQPLKDNHILLF